MKEDTLLVKIMKYIPQRWSGLHYFSRNKFQKTCWWQQCSRFCLNRGGIVFFNNTWYSFNPLTEILTVQDDKHLKETLRSTGFFSSHLPGKGVPAGLISSVTVEVTCACEHKNMHGNQLQVQWKTEYSEVGIINIFRSEHIMKMKGGIWH